MVQQPYYVDYVRAPWGSQNPPVRTARTAFRERVSWLQTGTGRQSIGSTQAPAFYTPEITLSDGVSFGRVLQK